MGENKIQVICREEQCAHYIEKGKTNFYRKKFVWVVIIFSFFCAGILGWLVYYNNSQEDQIIQQYNEYLSAQKKMLQEVKVNKGIAVINENIIQSVEVEEKTIENMLHLETTHHHAQFTLLSVWAGVLMVVFLVFSLYSMFKTDELVKQARESIDTIGNSKAEVDAKIQEVDAKVAAEVEHIKKVSNDYINDIKKQINEEQSKVNENIHNTGKELSQAYAQHKEKLAEMQHELQLIVQGVSTVVDAVNKTGTSEKKGQSVREEQSNNKSE